MKFYQVFQNEKLLGMLIASAETLLEKVIEFCIKFNICHKNGKISTIPCAKVSPINYKSEADHKKAEVIHTEVENADTF